MKKYLIVLTACIIAIICLNIVFASGEESNIIYDSGDVLLIEDNNAEGEVLEKEINEVIKTDKEKNLMLLGQKLEIGGEAKDLIIAAGESIASRAIGSYAFMAAKDLNISGEVLKDTFAAGNEINVQGTIKRDLYAIGNAITITGTVERDIYAGGEALDISGNVYGDITFVGSIITIEPSAIITGNIEVTAETIEIKDEASIGGTVIYRSDTRNITIPNYVQTSIKEVEEVETAPEENKFVEKIKDFIWWTVSNCILLAVMSFIFPGMFKKIEEIYSTDNVQKYCSSFGWGLLSLIVIPIISILLLFTLIGSTLGILAIILYTIGYIIAVPIVGYAISNIISENVSNKYLRGFLGIVLIELLRRLPIIGGWVALIVNSIAFGTVLKLIKSGRSKGDVIPTSTEE